MNPEVKVLGTNLTIELARIYISSLQQHIATYDALSDSLGGEREEEADLLIKEELGVDLDSWLRIYSINEIDNMMKKVIRVNYHQRHKTGRGVTVVAHPSGKTNGSALWEMESEIRPTKVLLVNEISSHGWRACQTYDIQRIKQSHA